MRQTKRFILSGAATAAIILAGDMVLAQAPPSGSPAPAPGLPVPPPPPPPGAPAGLVDVDRIVTRAHREAADAIANAHEQTSRVHRQIAKMHGDFRQAGASGQGRALIIPAAAPEPDTVAELQEDLAVMARLIEKSAGAGHRRPTALGIDVLTFAGGPAAQNIYVGGYGAIFHVSVPFPLSPSKEGRNEGDSEPGNSAWDDARREVFGGGEFEVRLFGPEVEERWVREEYKEERVEQLKDALATALQNGHRIRHLGQDERLSVVVTSAGAEYMERRVHRGQDGKGEQVRRRSTPQNVLVLHAKKADVDQAAKGELKAEDFKKKLTIVSY